MTDAELRKIASDAHNGREQGWDVIGITDAIDLAEELIAARAAIARLTGATNKDVSEQQKVLSDLEGVIDEQLYDERKNGSENEPDDAEYSVNLTVGLIRRITRVLNSADLEAANPEYLANLAYDAMRDVRGLPPEGVTVGHAHKAAEAVRAALCPVAPAPSPSGGPRDE